MRALFLDPAMEPAKFEPIDISPEQSELEDLIGGEINIIPLSGRLAAIVDKNATRDDADMPLSVVLAGPSGRMRNLCGPVILLRRYQDKLLPLTKADELEYGGCRGMLMEA